MNCSEIDFNNIPIANWAGPQGGGGGGTSDPFPVHDGVYQVDRSMELMYGKTLTVSEIDVEDITAVNMTASNDIIGKSVSAENYMIFDGAGNFT